MVGYLSNVGVNVGLKQNGQLVAARNLLWILAPQVGLEPTTLRLTAECSAIELLRNKRPHIVSNYAQGAKRFL